MSSAATPEHNVTGQDFADRRHLRYAGPIIDVHAHVLRTRPEGSKDDSEWTVAQAETMLATAAEFGVVQTYSMCPPEDIPALRQRFGDRLRFNGPISKKALDAPDDEAYRLLDRFLEQGVDVIKFWSAPRGRDRGLFVDAPWRIEAAPRPRGRRPRRHGPRQRPRRVVPQGLRRRGEVRHEARSIHRPRADAGAVPRYDLDRRAHGRRS